MKELEDYYSSSRIACEFCGDAHESHTCQSRAPRHLQWSYNENYQNVHNPYVYEEEAFGLPPHSPEFNNYFKEDEEYVYREAFDELKESMKRIEATLEQLLRTSRSQPQEELLISREECSNEPTIEIHTKYEEEEEFEEEIEEKEDLEVMKWVDPILPLDESTLDVLEKEEPLVELHEEEDEQIEVDFVVEFLPQEYLKMKRQRDVEFVLKIQDKGRVNNSSRDEEPTLERSKSYTNRASRESSTSKLGKEPGTVEEHNSDTIPFDPGG